MTPVVDFMKVSQLTTPKRSRPARQKPRMSVKASRTA